MHADVPLSRRCAASRHQRSSPSASGRKNTEQRGEHLDIDLVRRLPAGRARVPYLVTRLAAPPTPASDASIARTARSRGVNLRRAHTFAGTRICTHRRFSEMTPRGEAVPRRLPCCMCLHRQMWKRLRCAPSMGSVWHRAWSLSTAGHASAICRVSKMSRCQSQKTSGASQAGRRRRPSRAIARFICRGCPSGLG